MNNNPEINPRSSFGLDDALFMLARHKWKILFFSLAGILGAGAIWFTEKTTYRAQAKVLVRYVADKKNIMDMAPGDRDVIRSDASVVDSEVEILKSIDSLKEAAKVVGVKKVLELYGGGTNENDAATLVSENLEILPARASGVITIIMHHNDPDIAMHLLRETIKQYQHKHVEVHRPEASYGQIQAQTDDIKSRLSQTEDQLRRQKQSANIYNLEQTKEDISLQIADLRKSIFQTEAELAESRALLQNRSSTIETNQVTQSATTNLANAKAPSATEIARFNTLNEKLLALKAQESDLLLSYKESSTRVQQVRENIKATEAELSKMNLDPRYLRNSGVSSQGGVLNRPAFDWETARSTIASLEAKYQTLTNALRQVRKEAERVEEVETDISRLERTKQLEEAQYTYYAKNLEQARLDQAIDATKIDNISTIQEPARIRSETKKLIKKMAAAAGGGIGFGLMLAFLIDFVFKPTVKRWKDLETDLNIPVFASVPTFRGPTRNGKHEKYGGVLKEEPDLALVRGEIAPWSESDPMMPYYEAIRDRLVMSYAGDEHKPKIVGLTSCAAGAGVSRLATGLAASLSRDVERKVLLVGLEKNKVALSAFEKGGPTAGIEPPEQKTLGERDFVAQNLYSLATTGRNLAGASIVQSFCDLLPKFQASDYDYIIFDLPPLSQTGGSIRLASQMERTLLVLEADETSKETVKRVKNLLNGSQTNLFAVLNKTRSYGPKSLQEDI